jgi:hypothetical protein
MADKYDYYQVQCWEWQDGKGWIHAFHEEGWVDEYLPAYSEAPCWVLDWSRRQHGDKFRFYETLRYITRRRVWVKTQSQNWCPP